MDNFGGSQKINSLFWELVNNGKKNQAFNLSFTKELNQRVDEGNFLFIEVFKLINKENQNIVMLQPLVKDGV